MAEIAEGLCITQRYLRAIEEDDLKSLPGVFFYKSFVKQYAAMLGVPHSEIQPALELLVRGEPEPPLPGQVPTPVAKPQRDAIRVLDPVIESLNREYLTHGRWGVSAAVLGAVVLACTGFYTWWTKAPKLSPAAQISHSNAAPAAAPVQTVQAADDTGGLVLSLAATERTWLSISAGGREIFSGILQPGETKTLSGLEVARMKVGNAGGIEIRWNGKPVGPLGASGEVRTILLTPDDTRILEPPRPPGPDSTL